MASRIAQSVAAVTTTLSLLAPALRAQDDAPATARSPFGEVRVLHPHDGVRDAKVALWALYPELDGAWQDHGSYLADLQARLADRGVGVAVALPAAAAAELAAKEPRLLVASAAFDVQLEEPMLVITRGFDGTTQLLTADIDGVVDDLEACLADKADQQQRTRDRALLQSLIRNVPDGGEFDRQVAQCLQTWPRSGRAHACSVLNEWWCNGDLDAAATAVDRALEQLANEPVPMTHFVDLVLRGDRNDPALARRLAMAVAPAAAAAGEGRFTQLVHLRALLRAGQDRLAGRVAATLPRRLGDDARLQLILAETLMEGATPMVFRDQAERAVALAEKNGGDRQWVYAARHKILKRCGDDDAAAKLMEAYRAQGGGAGSLNNDAWYLMVRPETLGRFDTLALAQCQEMVRQEGQALDFNSKDTTALAWFLNGHLDEAVELQSEVKQAGGNSSTYAARLRRYQETQKALAERGQSPAGTRR